MLRFVFSWFLTFLVFTPARVACALQHNHVSNQPDRMGTVHFDTSCSPEVRDEFDLAVYCESRPVRKRSIATSLSAFQNRKLGSFSPHWMYGTTK
jgi:hypothetical protein